MRFSVSVQNGSEFITENAYQCYGELGRYRFVWDNSIATLTPSGVYTIAATAFSSSQEEGTSMSVSYQMTVEFSPPPSNLVGTVGDTLVALTWGAPDGGPRNYQLWRSKDGATWAPYVSDLDSPSYSDVSVDNLQDYYYKVRALDAFDRFSDFSNVAGPLQPHPDPDVTEPTTPGGFTVVKVTGQRAITLSWNVSTDPGSPSSGVKGYSIERSLDNVTWAQVVSADALNLLTYTDVSVPAWNTTYYYRVRAVDGVNLSSPWAGPLFAKTDVQPKWNLTVTNTNNGQSISVWVQSATDPYLFWRGVVNPSTSTSTKPSGLSIAKKASKVFYKLPQDTYNVWTAGGQTQSVTITAATTVSFSK